MSSVNVSHSSNAIQYYCHIIYVNGRMPKKDPLLGLMSFIRGNKWIYDRIKNKEKPKNDQKTVLV